MPLPASGALSFSQLATEFNRPLPLNLSSLYGVVAGIPGSGAMSLSAFYGKSATSAGSEIITMTVSSYRSVADGKLVTVSNTAYGCISGTMGAVAPTAYRATPIYEISYLAFDNGQKFLVITLGWSFAARPATAIPATLAKRVVFSGGQSFNLPQTPSGSGANLFATWAPPAVGCHNAPVYIDASGYQQNLQYVIAVASNPFPLSGSVSVTLEYDV